MNKSEFFEPDFDFPLPPLPPSKPVPASPLKPAPAPVAAPGTAAATDGSSGGGEAEASQVTAVVERLRTMMAEEGQCLIVAWHPGRQTIRITAKPIEIAG